jgi:hypothetical protein
MVLNKRFHRKILWTLSWNKNEVKSVTFISVEGLCGWWLSYLARFGLDSGHGRGCTSVARWVISVHRLGQPSSTQTHTNRERSPAWQRGATTSCIIIRRHYDKPAFTTSTLCLGVWTSPGKPGVVKQTSRWCAAASDICCNIIFVHTFIPKKNTDVWNTRIGDPPVPKVMVKQTGCFSSKNLTNTH